LDDPVSTHRHVLCYNITPLLLLSMDQQKCQEKTEDVRLKAQEHCAKLLSQDTYRHSPGHPARSVVFVSAGLLACGSLHFPWPSRVDPSGIGQKNALRLQLRGQLRLMSPYSAHLEFPLSEIGYRHVTVRLNQKHGQGNWQTTSGINAAPPCIKSS